MNKSQKEIPTSTTHAFLIYRLIGIGTKFRSHTIGRLSQFSTLYPLLQNIADHRTELHTVTKPTQKFGIKRQTAVPRASVECVWGVLWPDGR